MVSRLSEGQRRLRRVRERAIEGLLFLCAASSVLVTVGIVGVLLYESSAFFARVSIVTFLTDTMWTPLFAEPRYGILPLLTGTLVSTFVGMCVAAPLGLTTAIFLSEFASTRVRELVKPILELLSGVPTVVFGFFALLFVTPLLQATVLPNLPGFNILSAGIVIGIMIIPYVASLSEDALRAVPNGLRDGSLALGATRFETAIRVVLPAATSGVVGALVLGISRAVGETMVVAIAAGQQPNLTLDPTQPAATITAYIVQVALGDLPHGSIGYQSIFAAGLTLLVMTLAFNILAFWLRTKFREEY
jgi:phosphate transport system permease protein